MVEINSSVYGSITINGVTYNHDVYIFPSGKIDLLTKTKKVAAIIHVTCS
jgi:hypothetical protein